jgi:hypothetical protein
LLSIVVFGTADQRDARATAEADIRAMSNEFYDHENYYQLTDAPGEPVWWSRTLSHFEDNYPRYSYRVDGERGAFGFEFALGVHPDDWPSMTSARESDTPLWDDEAGVESRSQPTVKQEDDDALLPLRDRHGDVWSLGDDGLMYTHETAPFSRDHVERKWGPLVPAAGQA